MEFLVLMTIGTVAAIWAVVKSRPMQPPVPGPQDTPPRVDLSPPETSASLKGGEYSEPMDELEYLEAVERHENDPLHYPFPSPPPRPPRADSDKDES